MGTTKPAAQQNTASAAPGCPYLIVAAVCPQLRQGAPVALLALLVASPSPATRKPVRVIDVDGYCPGDLLHEVA